MTNKHACETPNCNEPSVDSAASHELSQRILALPESEQALLFEMLERAGKRQRLSEPLDAVSFIHENLKAVPEALDGLSADEIESLQAPAMTKDYSKRELIPLPADRALVPMAFAEVLAQRRSSHHFGTEPLTLQQLSAFLHNSFGTARFQAAYNRKTFPIRVAPSAGGLQTVDLYIVANQVGELRRGLYYYEPIEHGLRLIDQGDMRFKLMESCINQAWIAHAGAVCILTPNLARVDWKYGKRAYRFAHVDTGVVAQSMYLVGTTLGLATCAVAGFYDDLINDLIGLEHKQEFSALLFAIGTKPAHDTAIEALL